MHTPIEKRQNSSAGLQQKLKKLLPHHMNRHTGTQKYVLMYKYIHEQTDRKTGRSIHIYIYVYTYSIYV